MPLLELLQTTVVRQIDFVILKLTDKKLVSQYKQQTYFHTFNQPMKYLLYFSLIGLLLGLGACKKEKEKSICDGVVCFNGGTCVNGVCVCDSLWVGADCSTEIIPIDSFVGNYHMVGLWRSWHSGVYDTIVIIDEVWQVTKIDSTTLNVHGTPLRFTKIFFATDTINYYNYGPAPGASYYSCFSFHRPFTDDSAYYLTHSGGNGGGDYTSLSGIKIH